MKILKPTIGGHDGSSFRELLDMWKEAGFCEVIDNDKIVSHSYQNETLHPEARPWVGEVGDIMLYDNPILDKLHDRLSWKMALWANEVHDGEHCYPWTFWPKHSKVYAKVANKGIKSYDDRMHESVFIGSYTTQKRTHSRLNELQWADVIQNFWMGPMNKRLYSPERYLNVLSEHKFGLCLPGIGPKCLRDIELIGLGTVPIFVSGVSTEYYNPLQKDEHFLFAETPADVPAVIRSCTREKWEYMSNQCQKWFKKNSSPLGSFELTREIIEKHYLDQ
mgnify:CR=1 FL=1